MFEMTGKGAIAARRYLVEIGKYEEFMNNRTSLDGYSLVQWANAYLDKNN